ncbi:MAG TPA: DUF4388 domain-containing protein [Desulfuromonadales bacterium]|nr:DUF4388 domain-containing protein [Desulfuromonadales bacterium]
MSFTGDLEHLPIVDVIQLLHATKKSGTLSVRGSKGESQLVFDGGYIVSANHLNASVRIGKILVKTRAITEETLSQALLDQKSAGEARKPLIAMLIERGQVKKEAAFKALEVLIELTIVEILTWTTGTFSLDVDSLAISDEYRYFPEKLNQDFLLNTQNVLMDALRIYDEKKRDGELTEEEWVVEPAAAMETAGAAEESWSLSADDLGLGDFDRLERKIPGVFSTLADGDPAESQRQKLLALAPGLSASEREELLAFLLKFSGRAVAAPAERAEARALILFSSDELFTHVVTTVCKHDGLPVFATNDEQDLDHIIDQSLAKKIDPMLVLDSPADSAGVGGAAATVGLRRLRMGKYPRMSIIQLASPLDYAFTLQSFAEGVRAVLPRPLQAVRPQTFVADTALFFDAFCRYLQGAACPPTEDLFGQLGKELAALHDLTEAPDILLALLQAVAGRFERSLNLVVGHAELIAERGIGIRREKSSGATPTLGFRIPLEKPSVFSRVIEEGAPFCGGCDDALLRERLYAEIGAPQNATILLLPVRSRGKTVALTYGDFGEKEASAVPLPLLEILAGRVGLLLENAFYRKKLEKAGQ